MVACCSISRLVAVAIALVVGVAAADAQTAPGGARPGQRTPPRMVRPGEETPAGTAVLRGSVVALDTGAPIRRAQVNAAAADSQDTRTVLTDEQGRFELKGLAGGRYTVRASKGGFVSLQYGQRRPSEQGTPVELAAGQTIEKLVIGLPRGSVITGRIVDEFGEPLTGATVSALRSVFSQGVRRLTPAGASDRTDDQGAYRIFGLPPGEYIVSATINEGRGGPQPSQDEPPATGYAPTYYPGATNVGGAQRVVVGLGQEVAGIGFGLSLLRLSKVSGRVLGLSSLDVGGTVIAIPDEGVSLEQRGARPGRLNADGTFEITGMAPGRYVLVVGPRGRREGSAPVGRTSITVSGVDLANVTIALAPPATITGKVETEGGVVGLRAGRIGVTFSAAAPSMLGRMGAGQGGVGDDFSFEVLALGEPGYLRVTPPPGWYLKSIDRDGQDITDTLLTPSPGSQTSGVRILLTTTASSVSGVVRDDRGNAVLDATVVVFPDDESKWTYLSRFISAARPDTTGRYEIKGLPRSNDYRVAVVQGMENGQASDPDFLRSLRDRAERLALSDGETKSLDLRLK